MGQAIFCVCVFVFVSHPERAVPRLLRKRRPTDELLERQGEDLEIWSQEPQSQRYDSASLPGNTF